MSALPRKLPTLALGLGLAALPLWAKPQVDFPLVRIPTLKEMKITKEGKSKPIVANRNGARYIFKANLPFIFHGVTTTKWGNFEAELVTNAIFKKLGMRVPNLYIVRVEGRRELHLRVRFASDRFTKGGSVIPHKELPRGVTVEEEACRNIQLVDLLVGNMDRHGDNVLFYQIPGEEMYRPVPIDHNLAFLTPMISEQRNWMVKGLPAPGAAARDEGARRQLEQVGTTYVSKSQLTSHPLWADLLRAPGAEAEYLRLAQALVDALPDKTLVELLKDVPDEVIVGVEPLARKKEIFRMLRARRDGLVAFFKDYLPNYRRRHGVSDGGVAPPKEGNGLIDRLRPRKRRISTRDRAPDGRPLNWLERMFQGR